MSKRIGIVGSESFALGFQLAGIRHSRAGDEDVEAAVRAALADPDLGILVVHADDVATLPTRLRHELTDSVDPVVVTVGAPGMGDLREKVKQAIGIDLYRDEDAAPPSEAGTPTSPSPR